MNDLKVARWGFEKAQQDEQEALAVLDRFRQLKAGDDPREGMDLNRGNSPVYYSLWRLL